MGTLKVDTILNTASETSVKVDRTTSDGDIIELQKDGTTVGSIGASTGHLIIGNDDTGLQFNSGDRVSPWNISTNSARDNAINLGETFARFKDLYLSGNIYLGGTGSANALDDYEEGTFTPTFGGSTTDPTVSWNTQSGHYTKIGNIVHINLTFYPSAISGGSGNLNIRGLPFTNRNHRAPGSILYDRVRVQSNTTTVTPEIEQNTTYMAISEMRQGENETRGFLQVDDLEATTSDNPFIQITITYTTD